MVCGGEVGPAVVVVDGSASSCLRAGRASGGEVFAGAGAGVDVA